MRLEVTVVPGPGAPDVLPAEVTVTDSRAGWKTGPGVRDGCGGAAVAQALAVRWPGVRFTVRGLALESLAAGTYPLVSGAVLVAGGTASGPGTNPGAAVLLAVLSGPGSGAVFPLGRGSYGLGRGRTGISIADPALSRLHGTVTVDEESITLAPAGSSGGFTIRRAAASHPAARAEQLRGPCILAVGDVVQCGQSSFALRLPPVPETMSARHTTSADAPRTPGAGLENMSDPILVPRHLGTVRGRAGLLALAVLPQAIGMGIAWLTGSWMFLAFAGMSALTVAAPMLGGSRRRRQFRAGLAAAAARDASRRLNSSPDAGELVLRQRCPSRPAPSDAHGTASMRGAPPSTAPQESAAHLPELRLGTAPQPANVRVVPDDPTFMPPTLADMPVTVRVPPAGMEVIGPAGLCRPVVNFLLMQWAAAGVPVVILGNPPALPLSARFLPRTVLTASAADAICAVEDFSDMPPGLHYAGPPVLLCLGDSAPVAELHWSGRPPVVVNCGTHSHHPAAVTVTLTDHDGSAAGRAAGLDFVPDGVPDVVFDRYARAGRGTATAHNASGLAPSTLPPPAHASAAAVGRDWLANRNQALGAIPLGQAAGGEEMFDWGRDGPHLLVAGTTGSGKSELLRTLVGGLALSYSPADISFILFDFKGGAGLGPLHKLPHTSSLITDLAGHGMERTLASLRAELRRRESLLAAIEATDLDDYRCRTADAAEGSLPALAHLVVVVDEFRVLVDQFPESMAELMRLAAVGRSLGIHLVLATQRPLGAVNADIRANVTTAICLRVQSAPDSQDVLGSSDAAAIPVGRPGRAFISRPGGSPTEFHCATLRLDHPPDGMASAAAMTARLTSELLAASFCAGGLASPGAGGTRHQRPRTMMPGSDVDSVAGLLAEAWHTWTANSCGGAAPPVVAPALPDAVDLAEPEARMAATSRTLPDSPPRVHSGGRPAAGHNALVLGLIDIPERQRLGLLRWAPAQHSHLACIGPPASGAADTLAAVVTGLSSRDSSPTGSAAGAPVPDCWLYLLDGDGSLRGAAGGRRVGSYVEVGQVRAAARLLHRLGEVAAAGLLATGTVTPGGGVLVLCISDWGRWVSTFRSSAWPWSEDALAELVRRADGRVVVLAGGERELLTAPFMASIPNRLFFPHGATSESRLLWPRVPNFPPVRGRAAVFGTINAVAADGAGQINGEGIIDGGTPHVAQLGVRPGLTPAVACAAAPAEPATAPPLVLTPLPTYLPIAEARSIAQDRGDRVAATPAGRRQIMLGVGGDGRDPVFATVVPGSLLVVFGGPGSGRTSFLSALQALNDTTDVNCVDDLASVAAEEAERIARLVDQGGIVVATLTNHAQTLARLPLGLGLRNLDQAVILAPRRPQDGDLLGIRLDTAGNEPPGRAVLIDQGRLEWFQFPDPQSLGAAEAGTTADSPRTGTGPGTPAVNPPANPPTVPPIKPVARHRFAA